MPLKLNRDAKRRLSTYFNAITLVCGAVIAYFPMIGLSQMTTGIVMMTCAIITALAQTVSVQLKGDANGMVDNPKS